MLIARRGIRRRFDDVLRVGVGLACLAGGAACGVRSNGADPVAAAAADRGEALYASLGAAINGTWEQREAARRLDHDRFQEVIRACMAAAGYDYRPVVVQPTGIDPSVRPPLPGYSDALVQISDGVAWPADFMIGSTMRRFVREMAELGLEPGEDQPNPGFERLDEAGGVAYSAQVDDCLPADDAVGARPSLSAEMGRSLSDTLRAAITDDEVVRAIERYPSCMAELGFDQMLGRIDLGNWFAEQYSALTIGDGIDSASWSRLEDLERRAATADAACRASAHRRAMQLALPALESFQRTRAANLDQLRREWGLVVAEARRDPRG